MSGIEEVILQRLFALQDDKYQAFQSKLIPNINPETVIGVRVPELRRLARELAGREETEQFLAALPHRYYDENCLHALLICAQKDYDLAICETKAFLPYIDNWATCDVLRPGVFQKHREQLLAEIPTWLRSSHTYTVRFGIGMLERYFLDEAFTPEQLGWAAALRSEEYYINMMIAWYFATALAKQYDAAIPYLRERCLAPWVHNKTIQKAIESYRITPEKKQYLRTLRISAK